MADPWPQRTKVLCTKLPCIPNINNKYSVKRPPGDGNFVIVHRGPLGSDLVNVDIESAGIANVGRKHFLLGA